MRASCTTCHKKRASWFLSSLQMLAGLVCPNHDASQKVKEEMTLWPRSIHPKKIKKLNNRWEFAEQHTALVQGSGGVTALSGWKNRERDEEVAMYNVHVKWNSIFQSLALEWKFWLHPLVLLLEKKKRCYFEPQTHSWTLESDHQLVQKTMFPLCLLQLRV